MGIFLDHSEKSLCRDLAADTINYSEIYPPLAYA